MTLMPPPAVLAASRLRASLEHEIANAIDDVAATRKHVVVRNANPAHADRSNPPRRAV
jgi:hypothetical protein